MPEGLITKDREGDRAVHVISEECKLFDSQQHCTTVLHYTLVVRMYCTYPHYVVSGLLDDDLHERKRGRLVKER